MQSYTVYSAGEAWVRPQEESAVIIHFSMTSKICFILWIKMRRNNPYRYLFGIYDIQEILSNFVKILAVI